ncbi:hypothetical protein F0562_030367 [Nyssa sinensis]|uniref:Uncharacterized protein n=1 Tax=Nyssa sinensis TaxID=561372 RepID=A0A5J5AY62_9ASTE|nr:hypothetical protein F0562_030367 [Nyssa sinensis]
MSGENSIVRFNGKNYACWEFQFRIFVKGKKLWGHLDESSKAPTDPKELSSWEGRDATITFWLLSFIEPHMVNNLCGFTTVPKEALAALQAVHFESQRDQFLMKPQPEFESARAGLINRTHVPSLEVCLGELLREEQRLTSQLGLAQDAGGSEMVNVAYAAQGRGRSRSPSQCYSCKEIGHIAARNSAIIARRRVISLRIVVYALRIDPLLLFILLFSPLLCLHLPLCPLFRVLLPTLLQSRFNR